jgi:hypothetical protein
MQDCVGGKQAGGVFEITAQMHDTLQLHFPKGALALRLLCERSLLTTFRPWIN